MKFGTHKGTIKKYINSNLFLFEPFILSFKSAFLGMLSFIHYALKLFEEFYRNFIEFCL